MHWNDDQPIFRQLSERISQQILQGIWQQGEALPSIRTLASDLKINHLTVMKSYQLLVEKQLVEKHRGQGMFVCQGAKERLQQQQKQRFICEDIATIARTLHTIDMSINEFIEQLQQHMVSKK